ncbi:hypothetical protein [Ectobacillus ponti]|uniref:Uncharacterized protein n=1 Tax=Ectobacillus ponti TaxID=2961894 RepID=A0AA42BPR9_9BACI|nr:hypothetical protein [Ectobacillus ponti]MCP8969445.1 hypothetical protein [Ectobacillus ponti]
MKINQNGSADMNVRFGAEQQVKKYLGDFNPFVYIQSMLQNNGFAVKGYDRKQDFGFEASRHYQSLEDFQQQQIKPASGKGIADIVSFQYNKKEQLFFTVYDVKSKMDFSGVYQDVLATARKQLGTTAVAVQYAADQLQKHMDLQFKVSLPIQAASSNADKKTDGGKTLAWNINPIAKNELAMTVKVPNIRNIAIAAGGALLLLLILFIMWIRHRRKKKRAAVQPEEPAKE